MPEPTAYIGRFAPSPSGPLHLGSLYTAVASYLDARSRSGQWLLRIEDLDPPREQVGAAELIIQSLRAHGLHWDGEILWQSQRHLAYQQTLQDLLDKQQAFYCSCSRRQLAKRGGIHLGDCIAPANPADAAIRLHAQHNACEFIDRLQGPQCFQPEQIGDMVLKRRDGLFAYQLAVVVDDIDQGINQVVRGIDLLDSTPTQLWLFELLNAPAPQFLHLPVLVDQRGDKLSKQARAPAITDNVAAENLRRVLGYLGQTPAPADSSCTEQLRWACRHWDVSRIPNRPAIAV